MKTINRVAALLLALAILLPSVLLWTNLSFIKTAVFSLTSAVTSDKPFADSLSASAQTIENEASSYIGFHNAFIDLYGLGMRLCGNRLVHAGDRVVAKLDSGSLYEYDIKWDSAEEAENVKQNAAALAALRERADEQDIPLLFVLAPEKLDKYDPGLPYHLDDYINPAADRFLQYLDGYGVEYIDLREVWRRKGWNCTDGFFYSDLHWRPRYAIRSWAYVTQYLNDRYGIRNDPTLFDLDNQTVERYDNIALGEAGRLVGKYYAKTDSTELFIPNYKTQFHLVNKRVGWDKTGTCEETTVDRTTLNLGSVFENGLITMYYARDSVVENAYAPNDANVVFIRDSFGGMLGGYVPLAFRNTSIVDLRTMGDREGETVQSIIDGFDTDLVMVFYHVGMVTRKDMFAFENAATQ